ncbi:MAG: AAA family ATPase [Anaerolineales bacterium]|nr:AAA family ATPase [Anaerolineales bacterium]MCX7755297.1 AAA family ATPase [Anaerolineales bacterium]MDW8278457.1 AAA family ATPase [Anaerolineales bacterium]
MYISQVELYSWKNFRKVVANLKERVFLVGPNASGKSNFLDALRFLRDLAAPGGGLQRAVDERGGVSKIRCLAARQDPDVGITVVLSNGGNDSWKYEIKFNQQSRGHRLPVIRHEVVYKNNEIILKRPDDDDMKDPIRLTQTALEQINLNAPFREIAKFFEKIAYLHLVPQIIRGGRDWSSLSKQAEAFGYNFLERVAKTQEKTRNARLRRILQALKIAVPQLKELRLDQDEFGTPHLVGLYEHWRQLPAKQNEESFSDGTLRLLGLLWALQDGDGPLLLEEPELSLHSGVIRRLPGLIHRIQRERKRQIFISTHSFELLSDEGIAGDEILMLTPNQEGTQVKTAASQPEIQKLLDEGLSPADVVIPYTEPRDLHQLELFKL